jgi:hypothetical protein
MRSKRCSRLQQLYSERESNSRKRGSTMPKSLDFQDKDKNHIHAPKTL